MGFFQELKEDLSQAVNELVPENELQDEEVKESITADENNTDLEEPTEEIKEMVTPESKGEYYSSWQENKSDMTKEQSVSDEVATITSKMVINGDVESDGSLDLIGSINGNICILGKLNITGVINGNSEAAEIYAQEAQVVGDITSLGSVKIGNNSVIRGNIYATSAVIAGAVKGDIDVKGPVILDSSAIVMGNIKSKAVQINNGAVIEGLCSQCYADINPASFFKD